MSLLLVDLSFSSMWASAAPFDLELLTMVRYLFVCMLILMLNSIRWCLRPVLHYPLRLWLYSITLLLALATAYSSAYGTLYGPSFDTSFRA